MAVKQCILSILVAWALVGITPALAAWNRTPGNGVWEHAPILLTAVDVAIDRIAITTADPTPANGQCAGNGAIYLDPAAPNTKFLLAAALTAFATRTPVYLRIDCGRSGVVAVAARLLEIQLTSN